MSGIRLWAVLTAVAGVVALGVVVAFQMLPEVKAAAEAKCASGDAVLRYEVATTQADLESVFGPAGSECRAKVIAAMDAINTLDVWLFIPSYTAFVSLAALFLSNGKFNGLALAAIGAALVALASDYVETIALLAYTPDLTPTAGQLAQSAAAAWIKFAALAVNGALLAGICFTATPRRRILGVLLCLPLIGVAMMFVDLKYAFIQTLSFLASWVPLLAIAMRTAVTGRG